MKRYRDIQLDTGMPEEIPAESEETAEALPEDEELLTMDDADEEILDDGDEDPDRRYNRRSNRRVKI